MNLYQMAKEIYDMEAREPVVVLRKTSELNKQDEEASAASVRSAGSADESRDAFPQDTESPSGEAYDPDNEAGSALRRKTKYDRYRKLQHTKSIFGRERKVPLKYATNLARARGPQVSDPFYL